MIGAVTAAFATVSVVVLPATGIGISVLRAALALSFPAVLVAVGVFNAASAGECSRWSPASRRKRAQETPAELAGRRGRGGAGRVRMRGQTPHSHNGFVAG